MLLYMSISILHYLLIHLQHYIYLTVLVSYLDYDSKINYSEHTVC